MFGFGIILGMLIGAIICTILVFIFKPKKKSYKRTGVFEAGYTGVFKYQRNDGDFKVQLELGELESTNTKSKVEVISMSIEKHEFNTPEVINMIKTKVNNSWIPSSEIEWIEQKND